MLTKHSPQAVLDVRQLQHCCGLHPLWLSRLSQYEDRVEKTSGAEQEGEQEDGPVLSYDGPQLDPHHEPEAVDPVQKGHPGGSPLELSDVCDVGVDSNIEAEVSSTQSGDSWNTVLYLTEKAVRGTDLTPRDTLQTTPPTSGG